MSRDGLRGRVAVVTGASRGIGAATARLLAARGAKVALSARSEEGLQAVVEEIRAAGGEALSLAADVGDPAAVASLFGRARAELGPVTVLVNNAGCLTLAKLEDLSLDDWQRTLRVNLTGPFLCAQQALADMRAQRCGVIVNVGSVGGIPDVPKFPGLVAYAASKGGLLTFSEALAAEVAADGIRVVCVSPASVKTDMLAEAAPDALAGAMEPERVAEVIAFLASEAGAGVNQTNVAVWGPPKPS